MNATYSVCTILLALGTLEWGFNGTSSQQPAQDPQPSRQETTQHAKDKEAVLRVGLDYLEALYEVKPELVERSVHPKLQKIGFYRSDPKAAYEQSPMTYEQLVKLSGRWNKSGKRANASSPKKVELLDLLDTTAVLKVTAVWGIDYMNVAKFDDTWKVIHILWQSHPDG